MYCVSDVQVKTIFNWYFLDLIEMPQTSNTWDWTKNSLTFLGLNIKHIKNWFDLLECYTVQTDFTAKYLKI